MKFGLAYDLEKANEENNKSMDVLFIKKFNFMI